MFSSVEILTTLKQELTPNPASQVIAEVYSYSYDKICLSLAVNKKASQDEEAQSASQIDYIDALFTIEESKRIVEALTELIELAEND
jgi:hypothetical protein